MDESIDRSHQPVDDVTCGPQVLPIYAFGVVFGTERENHGDGLKRSPNLAVSSSTFHIIYNSSLS
jgi:hypothetical protein